MSGRELFEEHYAQQAAQEDEEKSFDEIVAQALVDQQFLEQNTQLPGDVGQPPAPPPPPQVPANVPTDRGPAPLREAPGSVPAPAPSPEFTLENLVLPPTQTPVNDAVQDFLNNDSQLIKDYREESSQLESYQQSLESVLGLTDQGFDIESLFSVTPDDLQDPYISDIGPLAGLNSQLANVNARIQSIEAEADALNLGVIITDEERTAALDIQDRLDSAYTERNSLVQDYLQEFDTINQGAMQSQGRVQELQSQIDDLQLVYDQADLNNDLSMSEGMVRALQEGSYTARPIYDSAQRLIDASTEARQNWDRERSRLEALEFGAPLEYIEARGGRRADLSQQVVPANLPGTLEAINAELPESMQLSQIAAYENPYGAGDPVPVADELVGLGSEYRQANTPGLLETLGLAGPMSAYTDLYTELGGAGVDEIRDLLQNNPEIATALGIVTPLGALKAVNDVAGSQLIGAGSDILKASEFVARGLAADTVLLGEDLIDYGRAGYNFTHGQNDEASAAIQAISNRELARREAAGIEDTGLRGIGQAFSNQQGIYDARVEDYWDMPWYVRGAGFAAELILFDPLNAIPGVGATRRIYNGSKMAIVSKNSRTFKGVFKAAVRDAEARGLEIDRAYLAAEEHLTRTGLSIPDSYKFGEAQVSFAQTAKGALRDVPELEANIFANRVATRTRAMDDTPEEWGRVLNEELRRLADRNGVTLDEKTLGKFNDAMREHQAYAGLKGSEFWTEQQKELPQAVRYNPKVEASPYSAVDSVENPRELTDIVGPGRGPGVATAEDWAVSTDYADLRPVRPGEEGGSRHLRADGSLPPEDPNVDVDDYDLAALRFFAEKNGTPLTKDPGTKAEWRDMMMEVTAFPNTPGVNYKNTNLIPETSFGDVMRHRSVQEVLAHQNSGRTAVAYSPYLDKAVTKDQLRHLWRASVIHGDDYLKKLIDPVGPFTIGTRKRAAAIIDSIPLTPTQKAELSNLMRKGVLEPEDLDSLGFNRGEELLRAIKAKPDNQRDPASVAMHYLNNPVETNRLIVEQSHKRELSLVLRDLLTDIKSAQYPTTRPKILPDGVTVSGFIRMTPTQMMELFRNAPESIRRLNTYGPLIDEMGEAAGRIAQHVDEIGRGQIAMMLDDESGIPVSLLDDAKYKLDSMLDDLTQNAELSETHIFLNWVTDAYNGSIGDVPSRALSTKLDRTTTAAKMMDASTTQKPILLRRGVTDLGVRKAHRAAMAEMRNAYNTIAVNTRYTLKGTLDVRELNWSRLARMEDRSEAISQVVKHFQHKDSPLSLDDFHNYVREMRSSGPGADVFVNPRTGEPFKSRDPKIDQMLTHFAQVEDAIQVMDGTIADLETGVRDLAKELGTDIRYMGGEDKVLSSAEFAKRWEAQYPEYAKYDEDLTKIDSDTLAVASANDLARVAEKSKNDPQAFTPKIAEIPVHQYDKGTKQGGAYFYRASWVSDADINQQVRVAAREFDNLPKHEVTFTELSGALTPGGVDIASEDVATQSLMIYGHTTTEAARIASESLGKKVSQRDIEDARRAITGALGDTVSRQKLDADAKRMRRALQGIQDFVDEAGVDPVRVTGGVVELEPGNATKLFLDWLDDKQNLYLIGDRGPGEITKAAARGTRAVIGAAGRAIAGPERAQFDKEFIDPLLGYVKFSVPSGSPASSKTMRLFGEEGKRFIRPSIQRPVVNTFDPYINFHRDIDWKTHGKAYDRIMSQYHAADEVWDDETLSKFSPKYLAALSDGSKGLAMGNNVSFVGHRIMSYVLDTAKARKENLTDPYSEIINVMDDIVDGEPGAMSVFGDMFTSSEEMGRTIKWLRTEQTHRGLKMTNWEHMKRQWGDLTPHLTIGRMPEFIFDEMFQPVKTRVARVRGRQLGNRAPVLDDIKSLEQFVKGHHRPPVRNDDGTFDIVIRHKDKDVLSYKGLNIDQVGELNIWKNALRDAWDDKHTYNRLKHAVNDDLFARGWHIDDLDDMLGLDALDPYDYQRFADNMGTVATQLEHARLGYDPANIHPLLRIQQAVKATFGLFWLRLSPRYVINNIFGNYMSIGLNNVRPSRSGGVMVSRRVQRGLDNRYSSILQPHMLGEGITGTELAGSTQDTIARTTNQYVSDLERARHRRTPAQALNDLKQKRKRQNDAGRRGTAWSYVRGTGDALATANRWTTDFFEMDARKRVWTTEFDSTFTQRWQSGLKRTGGIDDGLKEVLGGYIEMSDVARTLEANGVDWAVRRQLFSEYNSAMSQAHLRAYDSTKSVMRDYTMRNRLDRGLDMVFPYHFWMTKNLMFVTGTILDRPSTIIQASRVYDSWSKNWENMPHSFKEKIGPIRMPAGVPGIGGKELWFRPNNLTNPAFFIFPAVIDELRDAWTRNEDTTLYERVARSSASGIYRAWEEAGYNPGPQWDATNFITQRGISKTLEKTWSKESAEWWKHHQNKYYSALLRPSGFGQSLLPLGGLEHALMRPNAGLNMWKGGVGDVGLPFYDGKGDTIRGLYAWMNQTVKGSAFTRYEEVGMSRVLTEMAQEGELGFTFERVENEDGTVTWSIDPDDLRDMETTFGRLQLLIHSGDMEALEKDPIGREMLDRFYRTQGNRSGVNYMTGLSFTEFTDYWRESFEHTGNYASLAEADDMIPIPPTANEATKKQIAGFNARIETAILEQERQLDAHNFDPVVLADSIDTYLDTLEQIYNDAEAAGVKIPQRGSDAPNAANKYAYGEFNPETGKVEGAQAPFLRFTWAANDAPEEIEERLNRTYHYGRKSSEFELQNNIWAGEGRRRGITAPYFDELAEHRTWYDGQIRELDAKNWGWAKHAREQDRIMSDYQARRRTVFAKADADGVDLSGSGRPPTQTQAWWKLTEDAGGDIQYLYEKLGVNMDSGEELMTLDQALRQDRVEDQKVAHTEWAIEQVLEQAGFSPYLEDGTPNPRFSRTTEQGHTYFDADEWERQLHEASPVLMNMYQAQLNAYNDTEMHNDQPISLMANPNIRFKDIKAFAKDEVLPKQSAYNTAFYATLDRYYNAGDNKEAVLDEGIRVFGPRFGEVARGQQVRIDNDGIATALEDFRKSIKSQVELDAFDDEYGHMFTEVDGELIVNPRDIVYADAVAAANQFGISIPTLASEYVRTRAKQAIYDLWNNPILKADLEDGATSADRREVSRLSNKERARIKEALEGDERLPEDLFLTITIRDDDTGEFFDFDALNVDDLTPEQVKIVLEKLELGVPVSEGEADGFFREQLFPEENETMGLVSSRRPGFNDMILRSIDEKRYEVTADMFRSGEAFLQSDEDINNYQSIERFRDEHRKVYDAGKAIIEETGHSWEWLAENLESPPKGSSDDTLNIQEFAEMYVDLLDKVDAPRLFNERRRWLLSDEGQDAVSHDSEYYSKFIDGRDPLVEDFKMQADSGTLYGFEGQDLENWQAFYQYVDDHDHLYSAAQDIRRESDWTWRELAENLEDGPIKQFAQGYLSRMEDYDMPRLWDQRTDFWRTEFGQAILAEDEGEVFPRDLSGGSGGSSGGGGRSGGSSGGGRNFGGSSSRYGSSTNFRNARQPSTNGRSINEFYEPVRDVFRLDPGMSTGDASDSQARFDIAIQIADLIQTKLQPLIDVFGERNELVQMMGKLWMRWLQKLLGEEPNLDTWNQALSSLGVQQQTAMPSEELLEQPQQEELIGSTTGRARLAP